MSKFKFTFTATREMTLTEIKTALEERDIEVEEGDDLTEAFLEALNDEGTDFFSNENMSDWDHNQTVEQIKAKK